MRVFCVAAAAVLAIASITLQGCGGSTTTTTTPTPAPPGPTPSTPAPPKPGPPTPAPPPPTACLCVFDIDRTLTGKHDDTKDCPNNLVVTGVIDNGYGNGVLTLSEFTQNLKDSFCFHCYLGTISAGNANGHNSSERSTLSSKLHVNQNMKFPDAWDTGARNSPLMTSCSDGKKQTYIKHIIAWYKEKAGVDIKDDNVYMFDDKASNISPFQDYPNKGTGYNAQQISCKSRDPDISDIGLCGATVKDVVQVKGVHLCPTDGDAALV